MFVFFFLFYFLSSFFFVFCCSGINARTDEEGLRKWRIYRRYTRLCVRGGLIAGHSSRGDVCIHSAPLMRRSFNAILIISTRSFKGGGVRNLCDQTKRDFTLFKTYYIFFCQFQNYIYYLFMKQKTIHLMLIFHDTKHTRIHFVYTRRKVRETLTVAQDKFAHVSTQTRVQRMCVFQFVI